MTRQIPEGMHVRLDYHEHPRGISAVLLDQQGNIQSVGFAKYNAKDEAFNMAQGEKIAIGRAVTRAVNLIPRGNIVLNMLYPVVVP